MIERVSSRGSKRVSGITGGRVVGRASAAFVRPCLLRARSLACAAAFVALIGPLTAAAHFSLTHLGQIARFRVRALIRCLKSGCPFKQIHIA